MGGVEYFCYISRNKVDQLYDDLLARHIKPFVELGFTPKALATSENKIFYWQGNTSHPLPAAWSDLIGAFIRHILQRYGQEEVRTWFFEVWNEPALKFFWKDADFAAYMDLYEHSVRAIKRVDAQLRVGGPASHGFGDHVGELAPNEHSAYLLVNFETGLQL